MGLKKGEPPTLSWGLHIPKCRLILPIIWRKYPTKNYSKPFLLSRCFKFSKEGQIWGTLGLRAVQSGYIMNSGGHNLWIYTWWGEAWGFVVSSDQRKWLFVPCFCRATLGFRTTRFRQMNDLADVEESRELRRSHVGLRKILKKKAI